MSYVVQFNDNKSGESPYGIKDAYPLEYVSLAKHEYDHAGKLIIHPSHGITPFSNESGADSGVSRQLITDLESVMSNVAEKGDSKITFSELVFDNDKYTVVRETVHEGANRSKNKNPTIMQLHSGNYIDCEKTTLSVIPKGGTSATDKTVYDHARNVLNPSG